MVLFSNNYFRTPEKREREISLELEARTTAQQFKINIITLIKRIHLIRRYLIVDIISENKSENRFSLLRKDDKSITLFQIHLCSLSI